MKNRMRQTPADFGTAQPQPAFEAEPAHAPVAEPAMAEAAPASPLQPPPMSAEVAAVGARTPVRQPDPAPEAASPTAADFEAAPGWPIYLTALGLSVLWALAPIAFAIGYRNHVAPLQTDAFAMAVFGLLAAGPAALVWGAAYMIRQGQKLAAEGRRAQAMAAEMLGPTLVAAARAGDVTRGVREEIDRAGQAADEARETLLALRRALALESEQLIQGTEQAVRTADGLTRSLGAGRDQMGELAISLDTQATRVVDTIGQQARMVADASDLAQTQLREAEASLAARAADLAAAAGEASDAARTAGEDLVRHIARLETAGVGVSEQIRTVETGLSEQRAALITLAHALRSDHEAFSSDAEAHAAKLADFIGQARLSSMEMSDRAAKGGEALKALMADAAGQFRDLAETAQAEREEFGQSTLQSLDAVSQAAADQRAQLEAQTRAAIEALANAAEDTRQAAAAHAVTARNQVDQLSEAAFTAGQKANQAFEARLAEARALVEQSSLMVEQAGAATARKLEEGAAAARQTLEELNALMGEIESRAKAMPATARGQADQVRAAVADGMTELLDQARRTAEEAQSIDAAFQDRVRRNFEMLSEAVRLMGVGVAAPPTPLAAIPKPTPAPVTAAAPRARAKPAATPAPAPADIDDALELKDLAAPEGAPLAEQLGLRPRLKLTPTATDEAFSSIFEGAGGASAAEPEEGDGWTWKTLLSSIDGADDEGARLQSLLAAEMTAMGVDPAKLLPKARIEEVAVAILTGDLDGARNQVKRLAPAATRRITRRLMTDDGLKRQVEIYVRRHAGLVDDSAVRDPEGELTAAILGSDAGRLYLLLDAAAGDMI